MASTPMPWVKPQYFTDAGVMATSYKLFSYDTGTTTKRATYTDSALTTPNANPIILDAYGRASIFLLPTSYTFVLAPSTDSDPPVAPLWTVNDIQATSVLFSNFDISGTAGETIVLNDAVYLSDGSGGATAGSWYKTDADQTYSSSNAISVGIALSAITSGLTGSIRMNGRVTGLSGLTAGTTYYASATAGLLTSTPPTNALVIGKADTTTSLIVDPSWGSFGAAVRGVLTPDAQGVGGLKTFSVQPIAYIGGAVTLPATVAGVGLVDMTEHVVEDGTDVTMTDSEIPANMLNADGKAVQLRFGSGTAQVGAGGKGVFLKVGGTSITIDSTASATSWASDCRIVRVDSDSVDVTYRTIKGVSMILNAAVRINSLDFTAAIDILTTATAPAANSVTQSYFILQPSG